MKLIRGQRQNLHPTKEDVEGLFQTVGLSRLVYNLALEQRSTFWRAYKQKTGKHISFASQCKELTALRAAFDFIGAGSQMAQQQALRDIDNAFKAFFEGRASYPQPRRKGQDDSARFPMRECAVRTLNKKWAEVRIPKIGWIKFRLTKPLDGDIRTVTIRHTAVDGWTASFSIEREFADPPANDNRPSVGTDRGVTNWQALSDGTFRQLPIERLNVMERRRRRLQKDASRGKKGSKRNKKAKLRVAKQAARIARVRNHHIHVETRRMARDFSLIVLEDLRIENMVRSASGTVEQPGKNIRQKSGLNRAILEQGWSMTHRCLDYKTEEHGGMTATVAAMNTSRECPRCGHCAAANRESQAVFRCVRCGLTGHADTVASINIKRRWNAPSIGVEVQRRLPDEALEPPKAALAA